MTDIIFNNKYIYIYIYLTISNKYGLRVKVEQINTFTYSSINMKGKLFPVKDIAVRHRNPFSPTGSKPG